MPSPRKISASFSLVARITAAAPSASGIRLPRANIYAYATIYQILFITTMIASVVSLN